MYEILIPIAYTKEKVLVSAIDAPREGDYLCPVCEKGVILKRGEVKVAHFAHKSGNECTGESALHKIAKLVIKKAVDDWKSGKSPAPAILCECSACSGRTPFPLPDRIIGAQLEQGMPNGIITDVALYGKEKVEIAVEVFVSHAVDEEKRARFDVSFIEVDGKEIINNCLLWNPLQSNQKPWLCKKCRDERKMEIDQFVKEEEEKKRWAQEADARHEKEIAARTRAQLEKEGLELDVCAEHKEAYEDFNERVQLIAEKVKLAQPNIGNYRWGIMKCWRCANETIVFKWLSGKPPPPIPKTVMLTPWEGGMDCHWLNTCCFCGAVIGMGDWIEIKCYGSDEAFPEDLKLCASPPSLLSQEEQSLIDQTGIAIRYSILRERWRKLFFSEYLKLAEKQAKQAKMGVEKS